MSEEEKIALAVLEERVRIFDLVLRNARSSKELNGGIDHVINFLLWAIKINGGNDDE